MIRYLTFLLLLGLVCPGPVLAEKPTPPSQLAGIFFEIVELEDDFEENKLQSALYDLEEIKISFREISPLIQLDLGTDINARFLQVLDSLGHSLKNRKPDRIREDLVALQALLFLTMDHYNFQIHPVVIILERYVNEAFDSVNRDDYIKLEYAMRKLQSSLEQATPLLLAKGAGTGLQSDFRAQVEKVLQSIKPRDKSKALEGLRALKKFTGVFVWLSTH